MKIYISSGNIFDEVRYSTEFIWRVHSLVYLRLTAYKLVKLYQLFIFVSVVNGLSCSITFLKLSAGPFSSL